MGYVERGTSALCDVHTLSFLLCHTLCVAFSTLSRPVRLLQAVSLVFTSLRPFHFYFSTLATLRLSVSCFLFARKLLFLSPSSAALRSPHLPASPLPLLLCPAAPPSCPLIFAHWPPTPRGRGCRAGSVEHSGSGGSFVLPLIPHALRRASLRAALLTCKQRSRSSCPSHL